MVGSDVGGYRILKELGEGGMGAVYLAQHRAIGRQAAIKVLHPQFSANAEMVQRFFNEARATALIRHPGLVDVYDFGQLPNGSAFLVMEMLSGESLASRLEREQKLPTNVVIGIARQLASAVGAAHDNAVVHRDLKPDNIFLVPDPDMPLGLRVKVLDFGIAKLVSDPASNVRTQSMTAIGTPAYMSPEQCRDSSKVDHRSDIYSLGCIVFHMACGQMPFNAPSIGDLMAAQIRDQPPRPGHLISSLPPGLEDLILKLLEKSPSDRPQTMQEVVARLDAVVRDPNAVGASPTVRPSAELKTVLSTDNAGAAREDAGQVSGTGPLTTVLPPSARPTTTISGATGEARGRPQKRTTIPTAVLGLFAMLALGSTAYWLTPQPNGDTHTTAAPAPSSTSTPAATAAAPAPLEKPPSKPAQVRARIESTPNGATVYRKADGVKLGETPFEKSLAREEGALPLIVRMDGYADQTVEVSLDADTTNTVTLSRVATKKSSPPRSKSRLADPFND